MFCSAFVVLVLVLKVNFNVYINEKQSFQSFHKLAVFKNKYASFLKLSFFNVYLHIPLLAQFRAHRRLLIFVWLKSWFKRRLASKPTA